MQLMVVLRLMLWNKVFARSLSLTHRHYLQQKSTSDINYCSISIWFHVFNLKYTKFVGKVALTFILRKVYFHTTSVKKMSMILLDKGTFPLYIPKFFISIPRDNLAFFSLLPSNSLLVTQLPPSSSPYFLIVHPCIYIFLIFMHVELIIVYVSKLKKYSIANCSKL